MASGQNLALQILINARDQASSVLEKVKGKFIALGAALGGGAIFGASVKEAATFEQAMDGVAAKMSIVAEQGGDGAVALQKLEAAAKEAGSSTKFSATEAANALQVLAASGLDADAQIASLTPTLNLAAIEGLELADAASIIGDVSAQMNIPMAEAGRIADVLAKGATLANTSVSQLGNAMKQAGSLAAATGMSFEQTVGALNVLANAGIRGEEAGTALRNILGQLKDPASKAREELRKLGVDTNELGPAFDAIANGGEQGQVALRAFGVEATGAAIALQKAGSEGIAGFAGQLQDVAGAAERSAKIASDNFFGMIANLKSAISGAAIEFATPILKPLSDQVATLAEKVREFTASDAFGAMSQAMVSAFNAATAAIGEFLGKIDWQKLGDDIAAFAGNAKTYLDSFGQNVQAIGSATAAAGNAISLVWNGIKGAIRIVAYNISSVMQLAVDSYAGLVSGLNKVGLASDDAAANARQFADDIRTGREELRQDALQDFADAANAVGRLGENLLDTGKKAIEAGQNIISAKAPVDELSQAIQERFGPGIEKAMQNLADRTREYVQAMQDAANGDEQAAAKIEVLKLAMEDAREAVADAKAEAEDYRAKQEALAAVQKAVAEAMVAYGQAQQTAANATGDNAEAAAEAAAQLPALKAELDAAQRSLDLLTGAATEAGRAVQDSGQAMEAAKPSAAQVQAALLELTNKYNELKEAGDDIGAGAIAAQMQRIAAEAINSGQAIKQSTEELQREADQLAANTDRIDAQSNARAQHLQNLAKEADARGDTAKAAQLEEQAARSVIDGLEAKTVAIQAEITAQKALIQSMVAKAELDGPANANEQKEIDAAIKKLEALDSENKAIQEKIRHLKELQGVQQDNTDETEANTDATEKQARAAHTSATAQQFLTGELQKAGVAQKQMAVATEAANAAYAEAAAKTEAWVEQLREAWVGDTWTTGGAAPLLFTQQYTERLQEQERVAVEAGKAAAAYAEGLARVSAMQAEAQSRYDAGTTSLARYIRELETAARAGQSLDDEDLSSLRKAIESARKEMEGFTQSAQDGLASLQQEWAELNGQQFEAQKIEHQKERLDIEQQIAEAQAQGNTEAVRVLRQQLEMLDKIQAKERETLQGEIASQQAAEAEATAREAAAKSAGKLKDTMGEIAELSKAASGGIDINSRSETANTSTTHHINETVVTHRLEIDAAKLFADESNVNEFIRALERAGLRVT